MGEEILIYVVLLIDAALVGIAGMLAIDRARAGYARAEEQLREDSRRQRAAIDEVDRVARAVEEQRGLVSTTSRIKANLQAEVQMLDREAESTERHFVYAVTASSGGDFYSPIWRFVAKNPALAENSAPEHPAAQWAEGRLYVIASPNQTEARSLVDRMLPRNRGFAVEPDGQGYNVKR